MHDASISIGVHKSVRTASICGNRSCKTLCNAGTAKHGVNTSGSGGSCRQRGTANAERMRARMDSRRRRKDDTFFAKNDIQVESARRGCRQERLLRVMGNRAVGRGVVSRFNGPRIRDTGLRCTRMMMMHHQHDHQETVGSRQQDCRDPGSARYGGDSDHHHIGCTNAAKGTTFPAVEEVPPCSWILND